MSTALDSITTAPNLEAGRFAARIQPFEGTTAHRCGSNSSGANFLALLEAAEAPAKAADNPLSPQNPQSEARNHTAAPPNEKTPDGKAKAEPELLASIAWSVAAQTTESQPKNLPNADPPPQEALTFNQALLVCQNFLQEPVERDSQPQSTLHTPRMDGALAELASNSALESARPAGKVPPKEAFAQQIDELVIQAAPSFELDVRPSTAAEKPQTAPIEYLKKLNSAPQTAENENGVPTPPTHITHQAQNSVQAPHHSGPPTPAQAYALQPPHETLQIHSAFWLERNADGSGSLLIELWPPALGPIEVLVSAKGTSVSADLIAPDQNAFELLQNHLGALQEALLATGLSVDTLQVNVAARDEHKHAEDRFRKTNRVRYISEPTTTPALDSTFRTGLRYFSTLDLVA